MTEQLKGVRSTGSAKSAFVRHFVEMVVAMVAGMLVIDPVLGFAIDPVSSRVEVDALRMATSMGVAMAAWMRFRGHRVRPIVEMCLAMYAGFVVLFPLLWAERIDAAGLMTGGHVLMLLFMLAAMLARPREYAAHRASKSKGGSVER